ncbi:hypothetical protein GEMRC1_010799 [Eukaryota sp. GEM-RC1]
MFHTSSSLVRTLRLQAGYAVKRNPYLTILAVLCLVLVSVLLISISLSSSPSSPVVKPTAPPPAPVVPPPAAVFDGCTRKSVHGTSFLSVPASDIETVRRASTPHLYRISTASNGDFFFKLECRPTFSPFHYGAQAYTEYLAFLVAHFLGISTPIPCHSQALLDSSLFPMLHENCVFEKNGEQVVMGVATSALDVRTGFRPNHYPEGFWQSLQAGVLGKKIPKDHKKKAWDLVQIAIMDLIMVNSDRKDKLLKNLFFLNLLIDSR